MVNLFYEVFVDRLGTDITIVVVLGEGPLALR